jgi:hypothetical protein
MQDAPRSRRKASEGFGRSPPSMGPPARPFIHRPDYLRRWPLKKFGSLFGSPLSALPGPKNSEVNSRDPFAQQFRCL